VSGENTNSGGIGFFGLLGIVFIALKLTHYIDWSWWWVLAPIWGPAVLWCVVVGGICLVGVCATRRNR